MAARAATARMVEINAAYERLREGGQADRPHRNGDTRRVRERSGVDPGHDERAAQRAAATAAHPAGDRPPRHDRDAVHEQPGDEPRRIRPAPRLARPAGAPEPGLEPGTASSLDAHRPAAPRQGPQLPGAGPAGPRGGPRHRDAVRQVPRPHARPDRRLRAQLHRLGLGDDHPRSRSWSQPRASCASSSIDGGSSGAPARATSCARHRTESTVPGNHLGKGKATDPVVPRRSIASIR